MRGRVDAAKLDRSYAGREFDGALLDSLPAAVDACGENGEFHTFVHASPVFSKPIVVRTGETVERDGFVFTDVLSGEIPSRVVEARARNPDTGLCATCQHVKTVIPIGDLCFPVFAFPPRCEVSSLSTTAGIELLWVVARLPVTGNSALTSLAAKDLVIEIGGAIAGNSQGVPVGVCKVFCQQDDLSAVISVMGELAIDGLRDGVRFAADLDGTNKVGVRERLERSKHLAPSGLPGVHECLTAGRRLDEFTVAVTVQLFAITREEVRPPRTHVAGHVLDDERDGVHLLVQYRHKLFVRYLVHRTLG